MQSLASGKLLVSEAEQEGLKSKVIGAFIGAVGFVLGKKKAKAGVPNVVQRELEAAYFFERSRKYDKAIDIYTKGLAGYQPFRRSHRHPAPASRAFAPALRASTARPRMTSPRSRPWYRNPKKRMWQSSCAK